VHKEQNCIKSNINALLVLWHASFRNFAVQTVNTEEFHTCNTSCA